MSCMLHCRPRLVSSRNMTSSVHTFAHPHSVFCDCRPNNHCTPTPLTPSPLTRPLHSGMDVFFSGGGGASSWVVCSSMFALRASGLPGQCVSTPSAADSHNVLQNVKNQHKRLFSAKTCESYAEFLRAVRMFESCSLQGCAWNPCYAKHTPLKSTHLSLTCPSSHREHEPLYRPPYLFTPSRCSMYSVHRGMDCISESQ